MRVYKFVTILFLILAVAIISELYWPQVFSKQDKIDPNNIYEQYDNNARTAIFNNDEITIPADLEANKNTIDNNVLGETSGSNKRIEVDLTKQQLYAYEGDKLVETSLISSGLWDRTPTGTFKIWIKLRSIKMEGGSKDLGTYYYLPNVPYTMFFYNDQEPKEMGFSLHGTYWHHNFGRPMSHGCINMKTPEAKWLYSWAEVGTPITIYGKYQYK
jgi:lipoprotein-anchoring transpeptidase ErfK/SrfK